MKPDIPDPNLKCLHKLLRCWQELSLRYATDLNWSDCPWWYNERASLSVLAASAWHVGGHAIEEYVTTKSRHAKNSELYRGRGDLYFRVSGTKYIAEAKMEFLKMGRMPDSRISEIRDRLLQIAESVNDKDDTEDCTKLGLLFIAISTPDWEVSDVIAATERAKKAINRDSVRYDAAAWVLGVPERISPYDGRCYPGMALLIKVG